MISSAGDVLGFAARPILQRFDVPVFPIMMVREVIPTVTSYGTFERGGRHA